MPLPSFARNSSCITNALGDTACSGFDARSRVSIEPPSSIPALSGELFPSRWCNVGTQLNLSDTIHG